MAEPDIMQHSEKRRFRPVHHVAFWALMVLTLIAFFMWPTPLDEGEDAEILREQQSTSASEIELP
jgi:hypothetical protein